MAGLDPFDVSTGRRLGACLLDDMSPSEAACIRRHVVICAECADELAMLNPVVDLLKRSFR